MKGIRRLLVLQHLEIEGPGLFEQFAKERDLKIEIIRLDNKNALPQTKKGDLILIMGGPMGVIPSYRSWCESDCFVIIAAGKYQEDTWSEMKWFSVNICPESA